MKTIKNADADRLKLNRETLRNLSDLQQVKAGAASVSPFICNTTTLRTDCC